MTIQFFGAIDRNKKGEISSEYPVWSMPTHIEKLEDGIASNVARIERGEVPQNSVANVLAEIERDKKRLTEIKKSIPHIEGKDKDALASVHKELGTKIQDTMFTYTDKQKNWSSPSEEFSRMMKPCIEVNGKTAELCEANGIRITNGKISRNQASKIYKIAGAYLGENTHIERLRKEGGSRVGRPSQK